MELGMVEAKTEGHQQPLQTSTVMQLCQSNDSGLLTTLISSRESIDYLHEKVKEPQLQFKKG
jgi:hypothetical protein